MQSSPRHCPQRVFAKTMTRLVSAYIYIYLHVSFYICMYVYIFTPKLLVLVWETFAFFDHWKAVCIHLHSSFLCLAILRCLPAAASDSISRWFGLERYVFGYYMLAYRTAPTQIVLMLLCVVTWLGLTGHKACSCKKGCTCLFPTDVCINGGTAKTICLVGADSTREHSAKSAKHFSLYTLELLWSHGVLPEQGEERHGKWSNSRAMQSLWMFPEQLEGHCHWKSQPNWLCAFVPEVLEKWSLQNHYLLHFTNALLSAQKPWMHQSNIPS